MSEQLPLFSKAEEPKPVRAAVVPERMAATAKRLGENVYLGTSSWSFPGWRGLVYDREASKTTLARYGLAAYASHPLLRTVGIDRTYYGPMTAEELRRYADQVPPSFRFVVKAHELLTRARIRGPRVAPNPCYLDRDYAEREVVGPLLAGLGARAAVLVFQFPPQSVAHLGGARRFAEELGAFLERLPRELLYAVELRNRELLGEAYLNALAASGACHAYNVHPTMPPIAEQASLAPLGRMPALVVRWMLRFDRGYEDARDAFYPFDRLVEEDPGSRSAIASLVRSASASGKRAFVLVNNKAEGSAPLSIARLAEALHR